MKDLTEYLAIAERNLIQIRERRPRQISISELGVWSKGPYKALVIRGGLLWRS